MANIVDWVLAFMEQYGVWGLVIVTFLDSFISPIPPEVLLIPLALVNPENALILALITTGTSIVGALVGYMLGLKGGRPLLYRFFRLTLINQGEKLMRRYGVLAVLIASFTPIPFKLVTITSGVLGLPLPKLIFWSILGRGARFGLEAGLIMIFGGAAADFLTGSSFAWLTLLVGGLGLIIYFIWQKSRIKGNH